MRNTTNANTNEINTATAGTETMAHVVMNNTYELWGKRIASVPVELLELDHAYQREETGNANKLAENWDDTACEFLLVSFRDGKFYIIDGQHRMIAAKIKGIKSLPCVILTGLTRSEEARRFSVQGVGRKILTPSDTFKANIECGNIEYKEVKRDMEILSTCSKYGVVVTKSNFNLEHNPKRLRSINRARQIIDYNGVEGLDWVIKTITESHWENYTDAYEKDMLMLLRSYYAEHINNLEVATERIKNNVMNQFTPKDFISEAAKKYDKHTVNSAKKIFLKELTR